MLNTDIFGMVQQVLADSQEKLASAPGTARASETPEPGEQPSNGSEVAGGDATIPDPIKVAEACEYLAGNMHLIVDTRTTQEKLAEYAALSAAVEAKLAAIGDEPQGAHQRTQANPDSISPMVPGLSAGQPGAGSNQMASEQNTASGTPVEPNSQGSATEEKVIPKDISPNEKANPNDANNALETNQDSPPGGSEEMVQKVATLAQQRATKLAELVATGRLNEKVAAAVILRDQAYLEKAAAEPGFAEKAILGQGAAYAGKGHRWEGAKEMAKANIPHQAKRTGIGAALGGLAGAALGGPGGRLAGGIAGASLGGGIGSMAGMGRDIERGREAGKAVAAKYEGQEKGAGGLPPALAKNKAKVQAAQTSAPGAELPDLKKGASTIPAGIAQALINKFAEDAINPASISAGTEPQLQSADGVPSAITQGTAAGEGVPATKGGDQGRELIQTNVAAINASKDQAKGQRTRSEMRKWLDEPAFTAGGDKTLNQSLDNTSAAGVKIAATSRAFLQKWADANPENAKKLEEAITYIKQAQPTMGASGVPGGSMGASGVPGSPAMSGGGDMGGMPMPGAGGMETPAADVEGPAEPVSDAALAAAAAGVSPEEVVMAEELLAAQMGEGEGTVEGDPEAEAAAAEEEAAAAEAGVPAAAAEAPAVEAPAAEQAQGAAPQQGPPPQGEENAQPA